MLKKLFIAMLFAIPATYAQAQGKFYLQAGYNAANISTNDDGSVDKAKILSSFNAGFGGRFGISKVFDIEAAILLSGKGAKSETYFSQSTTENYVKAKFNPFYLEVPVYGDLLFPVDKENSLFIGAGPYLGIGLFGKSKVEVNALGSTSTSTEDIKFNNDDPTTSGQEDASFNKVRRFDYGLNFHGGIDLKSVIFKMNYGLGLAKINSNGDNNANDKNKHRIFSFSVAFPLNNK